MAWCKADKSGDKPLMMSAFYAFSRSCFFVMHLSGSVWCETGQHACRFAPY